MGRPTKLTPEIQKSICKTIRDGNYAAIAARHAGVNEATFYRWMVRGREGSGKYCEFRNAVKRAEADAEVAMVAIVRTQAPENWQAAMTWLERKFPQRWARREKSEITISWRDKVKKAGYDPDELFRHLIEAGQNRAGATIGGSGGGAESGTADNGDPDAG